LSSGFLKSIYRNEPGKNRSSVLRRAFRRVRREAYMKAVFVHSLVRSRTRGRPAFYVIGDSHVGMFYKVSPYSVHWLGPATAYRLKDPGSTTRSNERLFRILKWIVKPDDKVLLVFGEVDCRVHIYNQFVKRGRAVPMEELIDDTVESYGVVLDRIGKMGIDFYVSSVPPASREPNVFAVPNYPPPEARCFINKAFNERLRDYCAAHGYPFVDVYSRVVDDEGFILDEFSADGTHLNRETIEFFNEGLALRP